MSVQNRVESGCAAINSATFPEWVPTGARLYLSHTANGLSLRTLARNAGCHASTVLRQVRRFENRRDDPLVDDALTRLDRVMRQSAPKTSIMENADMAKPAPSSFETAAPVCTTDDLLHLLANLERPGSQLIVAPEMPKAVIMRDGPDGRAERLAVFDRAMAEMLALKDWIICRREGRVLSYILSPEGQAALRDYNDDKQPGARRARYGTVETPVAVLARRRDKSGQPFLVPELVQSADRLREDFVMAQLDALDPMPADRLVRAMTERNLPGPNIAPPGTRAARRRVLGALQDLGPGLSDMVLRVCCHLEGVESAEQAMGWSARSGKIVLRIGLQRLKLHYDRLGADEMLIG
ncbi:DUF6456 domain-containing protein [Roseibaca sp. Y0-43]|uniref:DUF6456 domain-containing protein n=1 Tax=Roseibaca sp. Y0-43 TaxID=2816854 RepID=UPI001D0C1E29|nr:DUF6456 domain-containing protein [Roseibaca sp. Y0-43]MCC1481627.1 helix-turn-helix domain-containing protein [Roseibaca sp. Y0-43]